MDFRFTPEQEQFRESVRRFSEKHLATGARARAHSPEYPWDVAKLMAAQGLLGITIAEADGGQGGQLIDAVMAIETVASVCPRSGDVVQAGNFGPIVLVGAGGTLAEIYKDYALRLAPVSEDEAAAMIAEVKGFAMVRGYRGLARGDLRALAQAVAALSRLALVARQPVAEAEINPLIVKREGVVAVDGLVATKE